MKKINLSLIAVLFIGISLQAQVWEGTYHIRSQEDVDSFQRNCKCTEIDGNLYINGSSINNLLGLVDLHEVHLDLSISNTNSLVNVNGLSNIRSVGRNLTISRNSKLKNVNHLSSLKSLRGGLSISVNSRLTDLNGLSNIESANLDFISIYDNNQLTSINAFNSLKRLNNSLSITANEQLKTIKGFDNLKALGSGFNLRDSKMVDINVFKNLVSVGSTINISDNRLLVEINLPELKQANSVYFQNNAMLNQINLAKLTSIDGNLTLKDNPKLTNLDSFINLNHIERQLMIQSNSILVDIHGLQNISSVGGDLILVENLSLTECCILSCKIRDRKISGGIRIENNARGCLNATQLYLGCEEFCTLTDVNDLIPSPLYLSPVPAKNYIEITLPQNIANKSTWEIRNVQGKILFQGEVNNLSPTLKITLTDLANGLYVFNLQSDTQNYMSKFIKQ